MSRCVYCNAPAEGNYSIHLYSSMTGPEVPLCDAHGSKPEPTCEEIWEVIDRKAEELSIKLAAPGYQSIEVTDLECEALLQFALNKAAELRGKTKS